MSKEAFEYLERVLNKGNFTIERRFTHCSDEVEYYDELSVMYRHCGPDDMFGFAQCDVCKMKGSDEYCGRYIVYNTARVTLA